MTNTLFLHVIVSPSPAHQSRSPHQPERRGSSTLRVVLTAPAKIPDAVTITAVHSAKWPSSVLAILAMSSTKSLFRARFMPQ